MQTKKDNIKKIAEINRATDWKIFEVQATLLSEEKLPLRSLENAKLWLQPRHFLEIVEERANDGRCGYPCCTNHIQIPDATASPEDSVKYRIVYSEKKILAVNQSLFYCSEDCLTVATLYHATMDQSIPSSRQCAQDLSSKNIPTEIDDILNVIASPKANDHDQEDAPAPYEPDSDIQREAPAFYNPDLSAAGGVRKQVSMMKYTGAAAVEGEYEDSNPSSQNAYAGEPLFPRAVGYPTAPLSAEPKQISDQATFISNLQKLVPEKYQQKPVKATSEEKGGIGPRPGHTASPSKDAPFVIPKIAEHSPQSAALNTLNTYSPTGSPVLQSLTTVGIVRSPPAFDGGKDSRPPSMRPVFHPTPVEPKRVLPAMEQPPVDDMVSIASDDVGSVALSVGGESVVSVASGMSGLQVAPQHQPRLTKPTLDPIQNKPNLSRPSTRELESPDSLKVEPVAQTLEPMQGTLLDQSALPSVSSDNNLQRGKSWREGGLDHSLSWREERLDSRGSSGMGSSMSNVLGSSGNLPVHKQSLDRLGSRLGSGLIAVSEDDEDAQSTVQQVTIKTSDNSDPNWLHATVQGLSKGKKGAIAGGEGKAKTVQWSEPGILPKTTASASAGPLKPVLRPSSTSASAPTASSSGTGKRVPVDIMKGSGIVEKFDNPTLSEKALRMKVEPASMDGDVASLRRDADRLRPPLREDLASFIRPAPSQDANYGFGVVPAGLSVFPFSKKRGSSRGSSRGLDLGEGVVDVQDDDYEDEDEEEDDEDDFTDEDDYAIPGEEPMQQSLFLQMWTCLDELFQYCGPALAKECTAPAPQGGARSQADAPGNMRRDAQSILDELERELQEVEADNLTQSGSNPNVYSAVIHSTSSTYKAFIERGVSTAESMIHLGTFLNAEKQAEYFLVKARVFSTMDTSGACIGLRSAQWCAIGMLIVDGLVRCRGLVPGFKSEKDKKTTKGNGAPLSAEGEGAVEENALQDDESDSEDDVPETVADQAGSKPAAQQGATKRDERTVYGVIDTDPLPARSVQFRDQAETMRIDIRLSNGSAAAATWSKISNQARLWEIKINAALETLLGSSLLPDQIEQLKLFWDHLEKRWEF